jgi:hypothetical protein
MDDMMSLLKKCKYPYLDIFKINRLQDYDVFFRVLHANQIFIS